MHPKWKMGGWAAGLLILLFSLSGCDALGYPDKNLLGSTSGVVRVSTHSSCDATASCFIYLISYEYEVDGAPYHSERVGPPVIRARDYAGVAAYEQKYPVGAQVTVYYERSSPALGVLEPGELRLQVDEHNISSLLVLIGFGIFTWFFSRRYQAVMRRVRRPR